MEIISLNQNTLSYLSSWKLEDMFPKSIYYPSQNSYSRNQSEFNHQTKITKDRNTKRTLTHKRTICFAKDTQIECIKALNNIWVVCGGNWIKVYDIENNYEQVTFYNSSTKTNVIALTEIEENNQVICAWGTDSPSIFLISILDGCEYKNDRSIQLIGHRSEVYDLKFSPKNNSILLSASKDCTIRLWNVLNGDQIVIFGGPKSHLAEVWCIDWHMSGDFFVSGGIDNSIKLYSINKHMEELINKSLNNLFTGKTLIKSVPFFSSNEVHDGYVDCVKFNGNFIISKSVNGIIKEWLPQFNKEGNYYSWINMYLYTVKERVFNINFTFNDEMKIIIVGNEAGTAFLFEWNESDYDNYNYFFQSEPECTVHTKKTFIKACEANAQYCEVYFGANSGEVMIYQVA